MPAFDRLNRIAGKAVDRLYGEPIVISGRISSDYSGRSLDPGRAPITTRGVFADDPSPEDIGGQRAGNSLPGTTRLAQGAVSVKIMSADAASLSWQPVKGDLVTFANRAGNYAVTEPRPLDHGDLVLILVRERGS